MSDNPHLPRPEDPLPVGAPQAPPPRAAARSRLLPLLGRQPESLRRSLEVCCTCGQEGQRREEAAAECRLCGHIACTNWCILRQGAPAPQVATTLPAELSPPRAVLPRFLFCGRRGARTLLIAQRVEVTLCAVVFRNTTDTTTAIELAVSRIRLFRSPSVSAQVYSSSLSGYHHRASASYCRTATLGLSAGLSHPRSCWYCTNRTNRTCTQCHRKACAVHSRDTVDGWMCLRCLDEGEVQLLSLERQRVRDCRPHGLTALHAHTSLASLPRQRKCIWGRYSSSSVPTATQPLSPFTPGQPAAPHSQRRRSERE